ncbi:MAG: ribosome silencing factor [Phycisphaerales bacterium]
MTKPNPDDIFDDAGQEADTPRPRPSADHEKAKDFALRVAREMLDDKCTDVIVLDLRGKSHVTDFFVVGSGTSDVQMRSVALGLEKLGAEHGMNLFRSNAREPDPTWIVLDFVDLVVHLFEPNTRMHYDLEMLWGDAPRLQIPGHDAPRGIDRAGLHRKPDQGWATPNEPSSEHKG